MLRKKNSTLILLLFNYNLKFQFLKISKVLSTPLTIITVMKFQKLDQKLTEIFLKQRNLLLIFFF